MALLEVRGLVKTYGRRRVVDGVDFDDELHKTYAAGRSLAPDVLGMWMRAVGQLVDASSIDSVLDLGAGTGRFTRALANTLSAEIVAADPSRNMLGGVGGGVARVVARAESLPFGDGIRCIGGQTFRLPIGSADPGGVFSFMLDLTVPNAAGNIVSGSSWNFQCWYRDPMGPGGSGFNLSDGINVSFL